MARLCAAHEIPHRTLIWTRPEARQSTARRARHAILADAVREAGGSHLLLGHTADDQAETFLMRARRGSSWYGLACMLPLSLSPVWPEGEGVTLVRPLLEVRRADLRSHLQSQEVAWVDDPSNENTAFERIRMRALLAQRPDLSARIFRLVETFQALRGLEDRAMGRWMDTQVSVEERYFAATLDDLAPERAARALGILIQMAGGRETAPRRDSLAALTARVLADRAFDGATLGGAMLRRKGGQVLISPELAGPDMDLTRLMARFQKFKEFLNRRL